MEPSAPGCAEVHISSPRPTREPWFADTAEGVGEGSDPWFADRLLAATALCILHAPLMAYLRHLWRVEGLSVAQSLVTPLVIAGLLYLRRDALVRLGTLAARPDPWGLALMLMGALVAAGAALAGSILPLALSAPICAHGYLAWTRGREVTSPLAIPIYLLIFLIPGTSPELVSLSHGLQIAAAQIATWVLQGGLLPTFRDGIVVVTGATTNTVTQDCSGMATFGTLVLYALVFSYVMRLPAAATLKSVLVLLPLALVANGLRVAFISYLLYAYGEGVAEGPLHDGTGVAIFVGCYALLFVLMRAWSAPASHTSPKSASHQRPTTP